MNKTTLVKIGVWVIGFLVLLLFVVSIFPVRTNYVIKEPQLEEKQEQGHCHSRLLAKVMASPVAIPRATTRGRGRAGSSRQRARLIAVRMR